MILRDIYRRISLPDGVCLPLVAVYVLFRRMHIIFQYISPEFPRRNNLRFIRIMTPGVINRIIIRLMTHGPLTDKNRRRKKSHSSVTVPGSVCKEIRYVYHIRTQRAQKSLTVRKARFRFPRFGSGS